MKIASVAFALVLGSLLCPSAFAQNSQQSKMSQCNTQAAGKTGDARKAFMKECLSAPKAMTPQQRMKACNQKATGMTGDDRKSFMKSCLSSKS